MISDKNVFIFAASFFSRSTTLNCNTAREFFNNLQEVCGKHNFDTSDIHKLNRSETLHLPRIRHHLKDSQTFDKCTSL